jgi:hypothetical protein
MERFHKTVPSGAGAPIVRFVSKAGKKFVMAKFRPSGWALSEFKGAFIISPFDGSAIPNAPAISIGDDAGALLAAMLQRVKAVVGEFGGVRMTENAEHTAIMFGVVLH